MTAAATGLVMLAGGTAGGLVLEATAKTVDAGWEDYVRRVGATVTALVAIGGFLWLLLGPAVREYLRKQQVAAGSVVEQLGGGRDGKPTLADQLRELTSSMESHLVDSRNVIALVEQHEHRLAQLDGLPEQVAEIDQRVAQFLAESAAEMRLMRAMRLIRATEPE